MEISVKPLKLDRIELSMRFGADTLVPLLIINDTIDSYVRDRFARPIELYPFQKGNSLARHVAISLSCFPKNTLTVSTGTSSGRGQGRYSWAKFSFNPNRILSHDEARLAFITAMYDLLPGGGCSELLDDGNVLYAEFAVDVAHANMATLDAYSRQMDIGSWLVREQAVSTVYLNKSKNRSEAAYGIYDKKRRDKETLSRIRRFPMVRIEARRRFNHNPTTQDLKAEGLFRIKNPFAGLELYETAQFANIFSAGCHASFLLDAQSRGVQNALASGSASMRERRLRMLHQCRATWWSPENAWQRAEEATSVLAELMR